MKLPDYFHGLTLEEKINITKAIISTHGEILANPISNRNQLQVSRRAKKFYKKVLKDLEQKQKSS